MNPEQSKKIPWLIAVFLILVLGLAIIATSGGENIDLPEEGSDIVYSAQARVVGDESLLQKLGGVGRREQLSRDLFVFARTGYSEYKYSPKKVVGFRVTSDIKEEGDKLSFDGRFGSVSHKIHVELTRLRNDRFQTSIIDTKNKLQINSELPSNTKRNQFIGKLPIETTDYTIDYLSESDSFIVNVFNRSSNFAKAEEVMKEALGIESLLEEQVIRYGAGDVSIDR